MSTRLVIVGGSDAGIAAGLRARELDRDAHVSILLADSYPNYSICGLPYLLGGEVADAAALAHRTIDELEGCGLRVLLDHEVTAIDSADRVVSFKTGDGDGELAYDRLIIATGAQPVRPPLPGLELDGVHLLHTMHDAFALQDRLDRRPRAAAIVGAGYVGLEMAEALAHRGLQVTVVEQLPEVLPTVDPGLGRCVRDELIGHGVRVLTAHTVAAIERDGERLRLVGDPGLAETVDLVLVSVGVRPDAALAADAGAELGERGAIRVARDMTTSLPDVWAAGDCAETWHRLLEAPRYLPLGTTAHKQGRVAGENAVGGARLSAGSLGTQVVKVFDLAVARTGLRDDEAHAAGFVPLTVATSAPDHKRYYPGAVELQVRWTADERTGRLLGCQLAGPLQGQVAKRIDIAAAALHTGLDIDGINDLDLSYTPPFGSPWDVLQVASQVWSRARRQSAGASAADRCP